MLTRKDLLQAHRLMTRRAAQALILGEPDSAELPMRRLNIALFSGVMVAVLVAAVFGIIGLLRPGGAQGLHKPGMLIVEKETGTRYVWCEGDRLCPVANYVSARLVAGADARSRRTVSRNSLSGFERGPVIGIPGAPDTLPDAADLVATPWSVCVRAVDTGLGLKRSMVSLVAGRDVAGRRLGDGAAVAVRSRGQAWLIWRNTRMRVASYAQATLPANPAAVNAKWLNAVPAGPDLQAPPVEGRGRVVAGPGGENAVIGQVYTAGQAAYVLLADGLARVSPLQMQLLLLHPDSRRPDGRPITAIPLDQRSVNDLGLSARRLVDAELPQQLPKFEDYLDTTPLCAVYDDPTGGSGGHVRVGATLPEPPRTRAGAGSADQFVFPPGGAAVAGLVPSAGRADVVSTYYLVTEERRFAFRSAEAASALGYELPADAVNVPAEVLDLIPLGPVLDPSAVALAVPAE